MKQNFIKNLQKLDNNIIVFLSLDKEWRQVIDIKIPFYTGATTNSTHFFIFLHLKTCLDF